MTGEAAQNISLESIKKYIYLALSGFFLIICFSCRNSAQNSGSIYICSDFMLILSITFMVIFVTSFIPAITPKAAYRFFITDLIIVVSHMIYPGLLASRVFGGFIFTWTSILLLFISASYILISFLKSRKIQQKHKN